MPASDVSVAKCLTTLTLSCVASSFVWGGCNRASRNIVFRIILYAIQAF